MIDPGLKDKMVIITGAQNPYGIGAGIARAFAVQGSRLFLHYFRRTAPVSFEGTDDVTSLGASFYYSQQAKSVEEVLAALRTLGGEVHAWEGDLADPALIPELLDQAER